MAEMPCGLVLDADMPSDLIYTLALLISAIAINHFCNGRWESWNRVPVVALKCSPQSAHSNRRQGLPVLPFVAIL